MYHRAADLIEKVQVIKDKTDELERLVLYMTSPHNMKLDQQRLKADKKHLIEDIQALARDIANDTRERKE